MSDAWSVGAMLLCFLAVVEAWWWCDIQRLTRATQRWHEALQDVAKSQRAYQADLDRGREAIAWVLNDLATRYPNHALVREQRDLFNLKMAEHLKADWRSFDA